MNIKQELRKVFRFLQAKSIGADEHGNNAYYILSGKKYFVGCMSYDEWYIEPFIRDRTERDEFHKDTLWETHDTLDILQLFADNNLIELKVK